MEKGYRGKLITIIILSLLILLGLIYLKFFAKPSPKPAKPTSTPAAETATATPEETEEPTPEVTTTPEPTPEIVVDLDSNDSINKFVNKSYTIDSGYVPSDLRKVNVRSNSDQTLRAEAADALEKMMGAALDEGLTLKLLSGYRSYKEQVSLYNTYLNRYGKAKTATMDAYPGGSEHQLGLAVDLGNVSGKCELITCFVEYPTYTWLHEHAYEYGYIERYPQGKESITGIMFSPWHFRYVGIEEAKRIHDSGLTMEEFYGRTQ
ncbi:MAG: M15 family metallopeptidase [Solobacterium sp.]|nr:M15 family metallopeptidase [Solobacterium sp.]